MLRIVKPNRWNHAQYNYEKAVAARIERFSNKLGYYFLENEVQRWLDLHCADSMDGITARVYIDTLLSKSDEEVKTWAESFIKSQMKYAANNIRYINETTAKELLKRGKNGDGYVIGRFIYQSGGLFHGIDTMTGIPKEHSFLRKFDCLDWLLLDEKPDLDTNHSQ